MKELFQNNQNNQTEITDTKSVKNIWLGRQYDNGTFTDKDFQNVDDVEEIQKLLDDTAEDESCSE